MNKYNNTYHITIKIRPADVKSSTYIDFNSENNKEGPKFKINDQVIIWKYKFFLQTVVFEIGMRKLLRLKKLKLLCHGHILFVILTMKKLLESFTKNNCKNKSKRVMI